MDAAEGDDKQSRRCNGEDEVPIIVNSEHCASTPFDLRDERPLAFSSEIGFERAQNSAAIKDTRHGRSLFCDEPFG